jgi:hypothetical protein
MPQQTHTPYHKKNVVVPVRRSGGKWVRKVLAERYEGAVYHFLRTPKGSLLVDPDYGTTFYQKRGQVVTSDDLEVWKVEVAMGFTKYLPDLLVSDLSVDMDHADEELTITVTWVIRGATDAMHGKLAGPKKTTVLI